MTKYFNVGAFFVLFREAVEAAIILSVLLRYVDRTCSDSTEIKRLRTQVWWGSLAGIILSLIIGIALTVVFYVLGKDLFGTAEPLWEGILETLAVFLLTWLAFRMLKVNVLVAKWEQKIAQQTTQAQIDKKLGQSTSIWTAYSLGILAFTVVVREGLEAVIFIAGVGQAEPISLIIPSILGLAAGLLVGWLLYRGTAKLNLNLFFSISCAILLIIAAGLAASAAHEFEEYYFIKVAESAPEGSEIPESTPVLWDLSACCSQKTNYFFQVMNALVGWRSVATVCFILAQLLGSNSGNLLYILGLDRSSLCRILLL